MQVKNLHYIHHSQKRDWIDWTGDWRLKKVDQLHSGKSLYYIDPRYIQRYMICFKTYAFIISINRVNRLSALCRSQKEGCVTLQTASWSFMNISQRICKKHISRASSQCISQFQLLQITSKHVYPISGTYKHVNM